MNIIISNSGDKPIYEQITSQIKNAILSGELEAGARFRHSAIWLRNCGSALFPRNGLMKNWRKTVLSIHSGKGSFVTGKNKELMKEEQFKKIEECLQEAVDMARIAHIPCEELKDVLAAMYDEG